MTKKHLLFFLAIALLPAVLGACGGTQVEADGAARVDAHADAAADDDGEPSHTRIPADIAERAGIRVVAAGPGAIREEVEVQGVLRPMEGRYARLTARFPGVVRELAIAPGDRVRTGQTLMRIHSNASLSTYPLAAPFAGTVLALHVAPGDAAGDAPLVEIADLGTLWADLHLFGPAVDQVRAGSRVSVSRLGGGEALETEVDRILPTAMSASQSVVARATLDNAGGGWRPGASVLARIVVSDEEVALRVPVGAVQRSAGGDVVYVREGETYTAVEVRLGRRDERWVEVVAGLAAGQQVVSEQSFLVKADIEKAGIDFE